MPKIAAARVAKPKLHRAKAMSPETPEYAQMLSVLRQFRVVIANIKDHYRNVEIVTGVSGAQLWALSAIARRPQISVGELARELGIHQSTASNLIVRLVELGHLTRTRSGTDLRVVAIRLTKRGKQAVASAPQPAVGMLQQALLSMPVDRLKSLQADLDYLIQSIGLKRTLGVATPLSTSLAERKAKA